jgi:hypothetical protein
MKKYESGTQPSYDLICFNDEGKMLRRSCGFTSKEQAQQEWKHILDCQIKGVRWAKKIVHYVIVEGKPKFISNGKSIFDFKI